MGTLAATEGSSEALQANLNGCMGRVCDSHSVCYHANLQLIPTSTGAMCTSCT